MDQNGSLLAGRVVGVGEARIEHLALVERQPDPESTVDLAAFSVQGAGTVATALATLAGLGCASAFWGKVADDDFGAFILRGLEALGVDVAGLVVERDKVSPYSFVLVERGRQRGTALRTPGTVSLLAPDEVDAAALQGSALLLLDGQQPGVQLKLAEKARDLAIPVVLDIGGASEQLIELVRLSDVLIATERYTSELAPRGEIEDSLREISRMGPHTVIVTMGREGSLGLQGETLVHQPRLPVDVVDTTGAGDVFFGGFCYGMLRGYSLARSMQIASRAAGLCCGQLGARAHLPTPEEIEET